jgi:hypothetical protein
MAARPTTPEGIAACRQRGHIAETPHANIKHNMASAGCQCAANPKPPPNAQSPPR